MNIANSMGTMHRRRNIYQLKEEEQPPLPPEIFWNKMLKVYQYRILGVERAHLIQILPGLAPEVNIPTFQEGELVKF